MKTDKIFLLLTSLGIYLLSTGVSFAAFNHYKKPVSPKKGFDVAMGEDLLVDDSGPKTAACPLNGKMFTEKEKERWLKRRPLTVMVENHEEARPQSGLSEADVVYEAVAEGGITRFLAVFYCDAIAKEEILGPVRSARTYFLDWASEYGGEPLYTHVGGAHCDPDTKEGCLNGGKADALGQIADYGWEGENDLNQFSIGYPVFWRDYERIGHTVATEHTMYTTTEKLWQTAEKRGWTNKSPDGEDWQDSFTPWTFTKESPGGGEQRIEFLFWDGYEVSGVVWDYDKENNVYKRSNGGKPHKDLNKDEQFTAKNVVIQYAKEMPANDGYPGNIHLLYGTINDGKAVVFKNGKAEEATWSKSSRKGRTEFQKKSGGEIEFVEGNIWIEIVPLDTEVEY